MAETVDQTLRSLSDLLAAKSSPVVHYISVICLTMGIIALLPLIVVVVYDLSLWAWRLVRSLGTSIMLDRESQPEALNSSPPIAASTARQQPSTAHRKQ
ncbi:hypothetical protein CDD81_1804 [Ophiocordyceps australis]|uniref:Uncharacterized protein n=1 Tax=Ophiocordyceps australis TaxID=1399860 RepID=A0A2C5XY62_9HYPO|nr:hypothetical protein CDD81_1804 [Ophiocordyceps australis]